MNRIAFSIVALGLVAVAILFASPIVSPGLAEPPAILRGPDAEKLTALRKERRDMLRDALKLAEQAYRNGVKDYAAIPRISINLLNADLELAPDHAARVAIREQIVEKFKAIEKLVETQFKEGLVGDASDVLEARAARLQAEIDLLREAADEVS